MGIVDVHPSVDVESGGGGSVAVSGQVVYLVSGHNEVTVVIPPVTTNISGQPVRISGETVYVVSGKGYIFAFDPSGQTWNELYVHTSGGHKLSVDATVNATAQVSGQVVYLTSGQSPVQISGQAVRISGETVSIAGGINVSGSPVRISGEAIRNYAFDQSGNTWVEFITNTSGGKRVQVTVSGDSVTIGNASLAVTTSVSGNAVSISGNIVNTSGQVAIISGQPVRVSGETISIAGTVPVSTSVSGNMVSISGQPVLGKVSGEKVRLQGFDLSGATWVDLITQQSGGQRLQVTVSGDSVNIGNTVPVTTSVSGNAVGISGQAVRTSGDTAIISGQPIRISGETVSVSGLVATSVSGNQVAISGQAVRISGEAVRVFAFDQSGATWVEFITNTSGGKRVQVTVSGDAVTATTSVSGNMVSVSGQPVAISGQAVRTSGDTAIISGQPVGISGQVVQISGQTVIASVTTNISGQTVYTASGHNDVQMSGQAVTISGNILEIAFDPFQGVYTDVYVNASGGHRMQTTVSGDAVTTSISGQPVSISGQTVVASVTTNISGQTVYPVSGKAYAFAFDPSGNTWNELYVHQSGGHKLSVDAAVTAQANISGQTVYLVSGQNTVQNSGQTVIAKISGETVVASVTTNISGQTVYLVSGNNPAQISGQAVSVSGNILSILDPVVTRMSGQTVYLVSGQNGFQSYGFIQSSGEWQRIQITQSGQGISGIPNKLVVTFSGDSIIGSVSGNAVSVSGNIVNTSGQTAIISGQPVTVSVSGQVVYLVSGQNASQSYGYIQASGEWQRIQITQSGQGISGIPNKLVVTFSGDSIIGSVSGNVVNVSGATVSVSGQIIAKVSGEVVQISGQTVRPRTPQAIRTFDTLLITGSSGGVALTSGACISLTVKNIGISGTIMYVGSSGNPPWVSSGQTIFPFFSGRGFHLRDGEAVTLNNDLTANVKVVSHTSGQYVSFIATDY